MPRRGKKARIDAAVNRSIFTLEVIDVCIQHAALPHVDRRRTGGVGAIADSTCKWGRARWPSFFVCGDVGSGRLSVSEWECVWVNGGLSLCVWVREWVSEWVSEREKECKRVCECVSEWESEWVRGGSLVQALEKNVVFYLILLVYFILFIFCSVLFLFTCVISSVCLDRFPARSCSWIVVYFFIEIGTLNLGSSSSWRPKSVVIALAMMTVMAVMIMILVIQWHPPSQNGDTNWWWCMRMSFFFIPYCL